MYYTCTIICNTLLIIKCLYLPEAMQWPEISKYEGLEKRNREELRSTPFCVQVSSCAAAISHTAHPADCWPSRSQRCYHLTDKTMTSPPPSRALWTCSITSVSVLAGPMFGRCWLRLILQEMICCSTHCCCEVEGLASPETTFTSCEINMRDNDSSLLVGLYWSDYTRFCYDQSLKKLGINYGNSTKFLRAQPRLMYIIISILIA